MSAAGASGTPPPGRDTTRSPDPLDAAVPAAYLLSGTVISDGRMQADGVVAVTGGRIAYTGPRSGFRAGEFPGAEEIRLPPGSSVLPGLVDLHCHGAAGGDFSAGDSQGCRTAVDFLHRSGTTTLLASLVTASGGDLLESLALLKPLAEERLIAGIHAEGPFLSRAHCGAQNPRWLRDPDPELLREMLHTAGGTLKTMTYAPELPGAGGIVPILAAHGVVPSLGHTGADASLAHASLAEAARLLAAPDAGNGSGTGARPTVTHLFNGMPPLHHRSPGPVAACLRLARAGTVAVEIIADGVHLDPETVRMVFDLVGADNVVLVTDSMAATGLRDGDYELGASAVVVCGGVATLRSSGALAGGTSTLLEVVRRTIKAGVDPAAAVKAATAVPAQILGLAADIGSLRAGMRADVVAVDRDFNPVTVLRAGALIRAAAAPCTR